MRILVVNCNTSRRITSDIVEIAERVASPATEIVGTQPSWGVSSAEGFYESFISAAAVLDLLSSWPDPFDAVVMAGFGEHGREGARQLLDQPIVDITEAAAYLGALVGHRFGVATTMQSTVAPIEESLRAAGILNRCAGILAANIPVLDAADDATVTVDGLAAVGAELIARGADVILLGCAGFAGLDELLEQRLGVPVIDGTAAAVALAESLVRLGKRTSKAGPYAAPSTLKDRPGWPIGSPAFVRPAVEATALPLPEKPTATAEAEGEAC